MSDIESQSTNSALSSGNFLFKDTRNNAIPLFYLVFICSL